MGHSCWVSIKQGKRLEALKSEKESGKELGVCTAYTGLGGRLQPGDSMKMIRFHPGRKIIKRN